MNLAHCKTHDIKFNPDTTDTCPLCITLKVEPIERPSFETPAKRRKYGSGSITEREYQKKYRKLNYEKLKNYKTEWMRKKRTEWRKKYGKIFY